MALAAILEDADMPPAEIMRRMWARVADPALWPNERLFFEVYAQALQGSPHALPLLDGIVDAWVEPLAALVAPGPPEGRGPRGGAARRRGRARAAARPAGHRRPRGRRRRHGALHLRDRARLARLSRPPVRRVLPCPPRRLRGSPPEDGGSQRTMARGRRPRGPRGRGRARPADARRRQRLDRRVGARAGLPAHARQRRRARARRGAPAGRRDLPGAHVPRARHAARAAHALLLRSRRPRRRVLGEPRGAARQGDAGRPRRSPGAARSGDRCGSRPCPGSGR